MRAIWPGSISFGLLDVPVKLYSATESHEGEDRVILTKDDLGALPAEDNDNIDVLQVVPNDQIAPFMLEQAYFLEPKSKTPKSYLLLRQMLEDTGRTAIVKFTLRTRTRLATLRTHGKMLMVQTLRWADEIREVDFTPEEFSDDYQVGLCKLIDAKIEAGQTLDLDETFPDEGEEEDTGGDVIDLMEALRQFVDSARSTKKSGAKKSSSKKKKASRPR